MRFIGLIISYFLLVPFLLAQPDIDAEHCKHLRKPGVYLAKVYGIDQGKEHLLAWDYVDFSKKNSPSKSFETGNGTPYHLQWFLTRTENEVRIEVKKLLRGKFQSMSVATTKVNASISVHVPNSKQVLIFNPTTDLKTFDELICVPNTYGATAHVATNVKEKITNFIFKREHRYQWVELYLERLFEAKLITREDVKTLLAALKNGYDYKNSSQKLFRHPEEDEVDRKASLNFTLNNLKSVVTKNIYALVAVRFANPELFSTLLKHISENPGQVYLFIEKDSENNVISLCSSHDPFILKLANPNIGFEYENSKVFQTVLALFPKAPELKSILMTDLEDHSGDEANQK